MTNMIKKALLKTLPLVFSEDPKNLLAKRATAVVVSIKSQSEVLSIDLIWAMMIKAAIPLTKPEITRFGMNLIIL